MSADRISVIVPTCDRPEALSRCLTRLRDAARSQPPGGCEVVVSDDGRNCCAREVFEARFPDARWAEGPRKGPAANRNNGARHASGAWLAFCDDDCLPDETWLEAYRGAIAAFPDCMVFEGRTYPDRERRSLAEVAPLNSTGGHLWSCNFMIRSALFQELAGFDERFPFAAMEDVEFALRLVRKGYKPEFVPGAAVCHPWRDAGGWPQLMRQRESMRIFLTLHPEERYRYGASYFLGALVRGGIKVTLPGIVRFRGRGLGEAMLGHVMHVRLAVESLLGALSSEP